MRAPDPRTANHRQRSIAQLGVKPAANGIWPGYVYEGKRRGQCEPDGYDVLNRSSRRRSMASFATDFSGVRSEPKGSIALRDKVSAHRQQ
jgi:hypothetical protein